jgi:hypothetical protein
MANRSNLRLNKTPADLQEEQELSDFLALSGAMSPENLQEGRLERQAGRREELSDIIGTPNFNQFSVGGIDSLQDSIDLSIRQFEDSAVGEQRLAQERAEAEALEQKKQNTFKEIVEDGSTEPIEVEIPDSGGSFADLNPNNHPSFKKAFDELMKSVKDDTDSVAIEKALEDNKLNEKIAITTMENSLKALRNREVGLDLTPLAALIKDPNKAAILAKTLSPAFSAEERAEEIAKMEENLQDRKELFRRGREKLSIELAKLKKQKKIQAASAAVQLAGIEKQEAKDQERAARREIKNQNNIQFKTHQELRSKGQLGKDIDNIGAISETLKKLDGATREGINRENSLTLRTIAFDIVRSVQQGGVITDADLRAVGASPQLLNRMRVFISENAEGVPYSDQDKKDISDMLAYTLMAKRDKLNKRLTATRNGLAKTYRSTLNGELVWSPEDLNKPGMLLHEDSWIDTSVIDHAKMMQERFAEPSSKKDAGISDELKRLDKEEEELNKMLQSLGR